MAILLNDNLDIAANKPVDNRYGPYSTIAAAVAAIPSFKRHIGLTVGIGLTNTVDYWFKAGTGDADLIEKVPTVNVPVTSVAGKTGAVTLVKGDVGLSNVDNTSDADKPVSNPTQTALNAKQNTLVSGTNIKTINNESILGAGNITISAGGTQVNANWTETNTASTAFILNKPTLGTAASQNVGTAAGNVVQLQNVGGVAKLPALDGSQLTNLPGGGGSTNLSYTASSTGGTVVSDTGNDATLPLADTTNAGLMSPTDKTKLDGIQSGAEVNVNPDWNAASGDAQILNKPLPNYIYLQGNNLPDIYTVPGGRNQRVYITGGITGGASKTIRINNSNWLPGDILHLDVYTVLHEGSLTIQFQDPSGFSYITALSVTNSGVGGPSTTSFTKILTHISQSVTDGQQTKRIYRPNGGTEVKWEEFGPQLLGLIPTNVTGGVPIINTGGFIESTLVQFRDDLLPAGTTGTSIYPARADHVHSAATTTVAGFLSATDKVKIDGLGTASTQNVGTGIGNVVQLQNVGGVAKLPAVDGSQLTNLPVSAGSTNLSYTASATGGTVVSDTGSDATLSLADTTNAGLMSPADKTKLNSVASGAEVNVQANWTETNNTSDAFILNKPTTFPPSAHTHVISDVTGLSSALTAKQDTLSSGTNIKTINGTSLLGAGDISIGSGGTQVNSDWNATTGVAQILNKPTAFPPTAHTHDFTEISSWYGNDNIGDDIAGLDQTVGDLSTQLGSKEEAWQYPAQISLIAATAEETVLSQLSRYVDRFVTNTSGTTKILTLPVTNVITNGLYRLRVLDTSTSPITIRRRNWTTTGTGDQYTVLATATAGQKFTFRSTSTNQNSWIIEAVDTHTHTLSSLTQSGATTGQVIKWNGTNWAPGDDTGGTGVTNLTYTASATGGTVLSDTGSDATLTLADITNAGLMSPADKTNLNYAFSADKLRVYSAVGAGSVVFARPAVLGLSDALFNGKPIYIAQNLVDQLRYEPASGWRITDSNGNVLVSAINNLDTPWESDWPAPIRIVPTGISNIIKNKISTTQLETLTVAEATSLINLDDVIPVDDNIIDRLFRLTLEGTNTSPELTIVVGTTLQYEGYSEMTRRISVIGSGGTVRPFRVVYRQYVGGPGQFTQQTILSRAGQNFPSSFSELFVKENFGQGGVWKLNTVSLGRLEQSGATTGQVIKWNGASWVPGDDNTAALYPDIEIFGTGDANGVYKAVPKGGGFSSPLSIMYSKVGTNYYLYQDVSNTWLLFNTSSLVTAARKQSDFPWETSYNSTSTVINRLDQIYVSPLSFQITSPITELIDARRLTEISVSNMAGTSNPSIFILPGFTASGTTFNGGAVTGDIVIINHTQSAQNTTMEVKIPTWTGSGYTGTLTTLLTINKTGRWIFRFNGGVWSILAVAQHTHPVGDLTQSGATTGQVIKWNGTSWAPGDDTGGSGGGMTWSTVPATATATGTAGQMAYADNYLYICVAPNVWKRTILATW